MKKSMVAFWLAIILSIAFAEAIRADSLDAQEQTERHEGQSYSEIVAQVRKAVVAILNDGSVKEIPKGEILGTGFFFLPGFIVTADHVVDKLERYDILLDGGEIKECTLLQRGLIWNSDRGNPENIRVELDVAILELREKGFSWPWLSLAKTDDLFEGKDVSAWSFPKGGVRIYVREKEQEKVLFRTCLLSRGIISALYSLEGREKQFKNILIYHDVAIGPGSSGSPLFDSHTGEVVGITTDVLLSDNFAQARNARAVWLAFHYWFNEMKSQAKDAEAQ